MPSLHCGKLKKENFHAILVPPYSLFYLGYDMPMTNRDDFPATLLPPSPPITAPFSPKGDVWHVRSFM